MNKTLEAGIKILQILHQHDYEAYFVGGFVRDFLLEIPYEDIDITTNATPDIIASLFEKSKPTGLKYGTVSVWMDGYSFEVTTYRKESNYANHRHPENISFSNTLLEDLERRDFTINAFAMNQSLHVLDYFEGRKDLENKLIRAIGNPDQRFDEDALRVLRSFRFVSKLGFDIEPNTYQAIKRHFHTLKMISNERIIQEFYKILQGKYVHKALTMLSEMPLNEAFPELEKGIQLLKQVPFQDIHFIEFLAFCFYHSTQEVPDTWRLSNKDKTIIKAIIDLSYVSQNETINVMHVYTYGLELCLLANKVNTWINPNNDQTNHIKEIDRQLPIRKTCDLAFKGQDILALTEIKNGYVIGEIIDELILKVITHEIKNEYEPLKEYALSLIHQRQELS